MYSDINIEIFCCSEDEAPFPTVDEFIEGYADSTHRSHYSIHQSQDKEQNKTEDLSHGIVSEVYIFSILERFISTVESMKCVMEMNQ
ncbi:hypothetical protein D3C80_2053910 [compost metagenome]